jgi:hypothetical protein
LAMQASYAAKAMETATRKGPDSVPELKSRSERVAYCVKKRNDSVKKVIRCRHHTSTIGVAPLHTEPLLCYANFNSYPDRQTRKVWGASIR